MFSIQKLIITLNSNVVNDATTSGIIEAGFLDIDSYNAYLEFIENVMMMKLGNFLTRGIIH